MVRRQKGERMTKATKTGIEAIAAEALAALDAPRQIAPWTGRIPGFDLAAAYRVTASHRRLRTARGEAVTGRKLGFTNRNIWPQYGVFAPIWGDLFATTCRDILPEGAEFGLSGMLGPKIEPEIAFGLSRAPEPGMDPAALMGCIGWVAHGIEVVQSLYPGWAFEAPDTVAGFAMHGAYLMGPRVPVTADDAADWARRLADFHITLLRGGAVIDRGHARDVLDGPLVALGHLVELLAGDPDNPPLAPGEFVTTGTVTKAFDVAPGEEWQTLVEGLPLPGLCLRFR
jgi:2-oxo-3-hexenedioate decarboxylase